MGQFNQPPLDVNVYEPYEELTLELNPIEISKERPRVAMFLFTTAGKLRQTPYGAYYKTHPSLLVNAIVYFLGNFTIG